MWKQCERREQAKVQAWCGGKAGTVTRGGCGLRVFVFFFFFEN